MLYQDSSLADLGEFKSIETFRHQLFDTYIDRMFRRRGSTQNYPRQQTQRQLTWLAQRMSAKNQTLFLIERLQPSWLENKKQRRLYSLLVGLNCGVLLGLMSSVYVFLTPQEVTENQLLYALFSGMGFAIFTALLAIIRSSNIDTFETLKWTLKQTLVGGKRGFVNGAIYGSFALIPLVLILGLGVAIEQGVGLGIVTGIFSWIILSLASALVFALFGALINGFQGPAVAKTAQPNEGIKRSLRNSLVFWAVYSLLFGALGTFVSGFLPHGLFWGLIYGVVCMLAGGGFACFEHLNLRLFLYRMGYIPWNYAQFLDYAAERLFLQKVGGCYIFIHRMLLEHFAAMDLERP